MVHQGEPGEHAESEDARLGIREYGLWNRQGGEFGHYRQQGASRLVASARTAGAGSLLAPNIISPLTTLAAFFNTFPSPETGPTPYPGRRGVHHSRISSITLS